MSHISSEYPDAVLQYIESRGWSANLTKLKAGAYVIAGSREDDFGTEKMLLMVVCEPEDEVTSEHVEYLLKAGREKGVGSVLLTNTVGISEKAREIGEEHGVDTINPGKVRSHIETSGFELSTDEISMPDSTSNSQTDPPIGSDLEEQATQNVTQSEGSSITESKTTNQHPGEDGFAVKHAIYVSLLALIPTIILLIILPGDLASFGIFGFPLFAYLGYQRPTAKSAFGRHSFWSAMMLLVSPVMMIIHTAMFVEAEAEGTAEEAGATIGGTILIGLAFVVGLPLAIAFYLLYKKYDIDE